MTTDKEVIVPVEEGWYWWESQRSMALGKRLVMVKTYFRSMKGYGEVYTIECNTADPGKASITHMTLEAALDIGTFLHPGPLTPPGG